MIRWRNCCVRSSLGAEKIASGGLLGVHARVEENKPVGNVAGEAHLVGRDQHRHALLGQLWITASTSATSSGSSALVSLMADSGSG